MKQYAIMYGTNFGHKKLKPSSLTENITPLIDNFTYKKKDKDYDGILNLLKSAHEIIDHDRDVWYKVLRDNELYKITIKTVKEDKDTLSFGEYTIAPIPPYSHDTTRVTYKETRQKINFNQIFDLYNLNFEVPDLQKALSKENYKVYVKNHDKKKKETIRETIETYLNSLNQNSFDLFLSTYKPLYVQDSQANIKITRPNLIKDIDHTLKFKILSHDLVTTREGDYIYQSVNDSNITYCDTYIQKNNIIYTN